MGPTLPRPAQAAGPGEADAAVGRHRPPGRRRLAPRDRAGHSPQPVGVALGQRGLPGVGLRHGPRAARPAEARRAAGSGADRRLLLERRPGAGHGAVAARHRARRRAESHRRSCRGARPRHPAGVRAPARGDAGARPRRSRPGTGPPTTACLPLPAPTRGPRPPDPAGPPPPAVSAAPRRPAERPGARSRPSRCGPVVADVPEGDIAGALSVVPALPPRYVVRDELDGLVDAVSSAPRPAAPSA